MIMIAAVIIAHCVLPYGANCDFRDCYGPDRPNPVTMEYLAQCARDRPNSVKEVGPEGMAPK